MAIRKILTIGNPLLRKASHPVTKFDLRLALMLRDMKDTMYHADGVGLAAPQIGIMRRIVVIDIGEGPIEIINPEFISLEGEIGMVEGCLSVPGRRGFVTRPERAIVRAQDRKGNYFEIGGDGLLGRALQHEIDHLKGTLYVDVMDYEVFPEDEDKEEDNVESKEEEL
ncbi:MAG: peptide deformylase [Christensenellales bacterium]|jgi:peptide deformylase